MIHELKIKQCYLIHIIEGRKTFEIRINDRDFQVDDEIHFLPLQDEDYNVYAVIGYGVVPNFRITYVSQGYGLAENFVVLAIEAIKKPVESK